MAMRLPRFQFTIRRLILLIAGCAVAFALLRSRFGFLDPALTYLLLWPELRRVAS
jgi:hypothetical protein